MDWASDMTMFCCSIAALIVSIVFLIYIGRSEEPVSPRHMTRFAEEVLVRDPKIVLLKDFITEEECKELIELAEPRLQRSIVVKGKGELQTDDTRTSMTAHLGADDFDVIKRVGKKACDFLGVPLSHLEPVQVVSYESGQTYFPHYDYFMPERLEFEGSQRTDTIFAYLCDDFEGGATGFPKLQKSFKPKRGEALWWRNAPEGSGSEDDRLLHGGMPPIKGRKWGCNVWIRDRPWTDPGAK